MRMLVTGAAGFIGSHLCERLLEEGNHVIGVDCINEIYDASVKRRNIEDASSHENFEFLETDILTTDLAGLLDGCDVVFHLAAIPGVRSSWAGFREYVENNVLSTQLMLEAARAVSLPRFIYASSSSIYGNASQFPTHEDDEKRPRSPYGVSKLAGEHLCETYADVFGLHVVSLRFFTVYGPRQRPDMGVHRICEAALGRSEFIVFGSGEQERDMTFVDDVVDATVCASTADVSAGTSLNISGGSSATVNEVIKRLREISGNEFEVDSGPPAPGDVKKTGGDTSRARSLLGWAPKIDVHEGLEAQLEWHARR